MTLKAIYESLADVPSYAALCGKLGFSPRDCERLAKLEMPNQHWAQALEWVEKGMALEPTRNWHNECSHSLKQLKPEILGQLGRTEDALAAAWAEYQESPNEFAYEKLMRHVPEAGKCVADSLPLHPARAMRCLDALAQPWRRFPSLPARAGRWCID